jgi:hypothetical protein
MGDGFLCYSYYRWGVGIYPYRGRRCGYCQNLFLFFPHSLCRFLNFGWVAAKRSNRLKSQALRNSITLCYFDNFVSRHEILPWDFVLATYLARDETYHLKG